MTVVLEALRAVPRAAADGAGGGGGRHPAQPGPAAPDSVPDSAPPDSAASGAEPEAAGTSRQARESPIPGLHLAQAEPRRRPRQVFCGDVAIHICRDGTWNYQGSPIRRKELVCLFASCLKRDGEEYWIETPAERGRITVEDVPFVAVELYWSKGPCACAGGAQAPGDGQALTFRTNVDEMVTAGPANPIRVARDAGTCLPTPYVMVRDGLEARINRAVYYELVALAVPHVVDGGRVLGVWSGGAFFPLGSTEE